MDEICVSTLPVWVKIRSITAKLSPSSSVRRFIDLRTLLLHIFTSHKKQHELPESYLSFFCDRNRRSPWNRLIIVSTFTGVWTLSSSHLGLTKYISNSFFFFFKKTNLIYSKYTEDTSFLDYNIKTFVDRESKIYSGFICHRNSLMIRILLRLFLGIKYSFILRSRKHRRLLLSPIIL